MKHKSYNDIFTNDFYWRTHAQQEIDFIEEYSGVIHAYEFKWTPARRRKISATFATAYPNHTFITISKDNYLEFMTDQMKS